MQGVLKIYFSPKRTIFLKIKKQNSEAVVFPRHFLFLISLLTCIPETESSHRFPFCFTVWHLNHEHFKSQISEVKSWIKQDIFIK